MDLLRQARAQGFKGELGECAGPSPAAGQAPRIIAGLGRRADFDPAETPRRAAAGVHRALRARWTSIGIDAASWPQAVAEGLSLASYRFTQYRKADPCALVEAKLLFKRPAERRRLETTIARARLSSEAVCFTRDLVNRAPSDKAPQSLADIARSLEVEGLSVRLIGREEAAAMGMGSYLGVARGSVVEPVFAHLIYKPRGARGRVALVGKGITFDSGGLSLKPPAAMETMKCDMAGAAAVLGVFKVLPRLKPRAEIHGVCPFTYNLPGPEAVKPGDVLRAMNDKTIEVLNTDAEGRLILADALVYAARLKPDWIVDLATLTGAVVAALGSKVSAVMANNRRLLERVRAAARRAGEAVWELPLVPEYRDYIRSPIADLQNIGKARGEAGSIVGGLFLQEFVGETPWAHLDIAGTAWAAEDSGYSGRGGTGAAVRTLLELLSTR